MSRVTTSYRWHLRQVMSEQGLYKTTDLAPLLADHGVELSSTQIYRLVTGTPERLSLQVLAALCLIFDCSPGQLIEPIEVRPVQRKRPAVGSHDIPTSDAVPIRPRRARIVDIDT